jgi:hypothetical protein
MRGNIKSTWIRNFIDPIIKSAKIEGGLTEVLKKWRQFWR